MYNKRCFKCNEIKPLCDFYKHKDMADGYLNKCIKCTKKDSLQHRKKNIDRIREYDRNRGSRQPKPYLRKYRAENPEKYAAHIILNNQIRNGGIKKEPCEKCNSTKNVHGHHKDYSKPLDVNWLCCACHNGEHHKI